MSASTHYVITNSGVHMPRLIYGTAWKKERTTDLVVKAVLAGFRGIDTACQPKHYQEVREIRFFILLGNFFTIKNRKIYGKRKKLSENEFLGIFFIFFVKFWGFFCNEDGTCNEKFRCNVT